MAVPNPTRLDRLGACASAVCAVHCVLTGLAVGLLSVAGLSFLREPWVEALFFGLTVLLGIWAVQHGYRRHGSRAPSVLFVIGLTLVLAKHFLLGHDDEGVPAVVLSVLGGLCLAGFFVWNARLPHKSCGCFRNTECSHSTQPNQ